MAGRIGAQVFQGRRPDKIVDAEKAAKTGAATQQIRRAKLVENFQSFRKTGTALNTLEKILPCLHFSKINYSSKPLFVWFGNFAEPTQVFQIRSTYLNMQDFIYRTLPLRPCNSQFIKSSFLGEF